MTIVARLMCGAAALLALCAGAAEAASTSLSCALTDNLDPMPGRYQMIVQNPKPIRRSGTGGTVIPAGAHIRGRVFYADRERKFDIALVHSLQPGDLLQLRQRLGHFEQCAARADW